MAKIVLNVGDLQMKCDSPADFANWVRSLAVKERLAALSQKTQRETRFHEGKSVAYDTIADLFAEARIVEE